MKNILFILITIILSSCNEGNEQTICGCGGPTEMTVPSDFFEEVPSEVQTSGLMFFKDDKIIERYVPDDRWEHKFWILQGGCTACQRKLIVCNEGILNDQFEFLKEESNSDSIPIRFEGNIMTACGDNPFIAHADIFYAEIVLTSIKKID